MLSADRMSRRMPKVVSLRSHGVADKLVAGIFLVAGAWLWRRSRRAAVGSWVCGGAALAVHALTDYEHQGDKLIASQLHGQRDMALAGLTAAMPEVLSRDGDEGRQFFRAQAGGITVLANLTDFQADGDGEFDSDLRQR